MTIVGFALPALIAAAGTWVLTPLAARLAWRIGAIDYPNPRKIHAEPTPRLGGVAVISMVVAVWGAMLYVPGRFSEELPTERFAAMLVGLIPVFAVSLVDDMRSVRAHWKLALQSVGAVTAVALGVCIAPEVHLFDRAITLGPLAPVVSVLWILGVTNAFNLVDGLDGLSAGLALVSSISLAVLALITSGPVPAAAVLVLVGALVGFLPHNLYPARVFLGDAGATAIGFCLACLSIRSRSTLPSGMAILVPLFAMGMPVAETVLSLVRRSLRQLEQLGGGALLEADRDHIHHRLLVLGLDQRRAVFLLYGISTLVAAAGLGSMFLTARNAALVLTTLLIAAFIGVRRLGYDEFAVVRRGILLQFAGAPVLRASLFPVFLDLGIVALSIYAAIGLTYDDWSLQHHRDLALTLLTVLPLVSVSVFGLSKLYRGASPTANVEDLTRSTLAVVTAVLISMALTRALIQEPLSYRLFVSYGIVLVVVFNGVRSSLRMLTSRP